jgi:hypothetical protein
MSYQRLIMKVTGCSLHEVVEVEDLMRCECPTLDYLDAIEFAALARDAYKAMQLLNCQQSSALH